MKSVWKKFLLTMVLVYVCNACTLKFNTGDLLFVVSEQTDFEKSIVEVTKNEKQDFNFTHIGIINVTDTGIFIVEAVPKKGVIYSTINNYDSTKFVIGKLKPKYKKYADAAVKRACSHLGKGYDYAFDFENNLYYCSELVYDAFVFASKNPHFFETPNMTFKKDGSNEYVPFWVEYFEKQNLPIPEGKPGINPTGLSHAKQLTIKN